MRRAPGRALSNKWFPRVLGQAPADDGKPAGRFCQLEDYLGSPADLMTPVVTACPRIGTLRGLGCYQVHLALTQATAPSRGATRSLLSHTSAA